MIEGQEGVTWEQWKALAAACDEHGYEALFRSDHYLSVMGRPDRGSLDAWTTLAALAAVTSRVRLGTLVSPATFRHPSVLAKSAVTVDQVSGGRAELGIGAGWLEAEHRAYGFPFVATAHAHGRAWPSRWRSSRARSPTSASRSRASTTRSRTSTRGPSRSSARARRSIVGGRGGRRSLALAARWADEYNTFSASVDEIRERREAFAEAWREAGRDPDAFRFSAMVDRARRRRRRASCASARPARGMAGT